MFTDVLKEQQVLGEFHLSAPMKIVIIYEYSINRLVEYFNQLLLVSEMYVETCQT